MCPSCIAATPLLLHAATVMRAIDLLSQMLAPVAAGFIMSYGSMLAAITVLSVYSLCAWVPECWFLRAAHSKSLALR